jgi:protein-tyrosine phosphatase
MNILFVCTGNICRSPAAEAIFRTLAAEAGMDGRVACDSAGTIGYHAGEPADSRMRAAAARRGYELESISRKVRPQDFTDFDLIIAMDQEHLESLQALQREHGGGARIALMCDYATRHSEREVPDPYYGGNRGFEHVVDLLEDACAGLLQALEKE